MVVGCSAIHRAREAQDGLLDKSADAYSPAASPRLDLRGYSLQRLVDFAMTNRPSVVSRVLEVEDARLALREIAADAPLVSGTPWLAPRVNVRASYSESSAGTSFSDGEFKTKKGKLTGALSLELLVWDFGRNDARVRAQSEKVLAAELQLVDEGYQVFNEVATAYFTLLEKGAMMEVARTNEFEYSAHLDQAKQRFEAGDAKQLDVLRAQLDLAQAKEKTANADRDVRIAGVDLMRALGVDASAGTREEVMDFEENALSFVLRGFPDTDFTAGAAFGLARTNAPAIRLARARLRAASADVDYAIANLYPEISVDASLSWTDPLWYFGWGAAAVQSVFQGFRKVTAVDRSVVALHQASATVDDEEQRLSLRLEEAVANRDNAVVARRTAEESFRRADENLRLVKEQYELGDVSRVDFTDSVADYVTAMGNRISAFYAGQRSEAAIFALTGVDPVYEEKKITEEKKP